MNKYFNKKVMVDGIKFDSKKEAKRFQELMILKKTKLIKELELQKVFELQPKYTNNKGEHINATKLKLRLLESQVSREWSNVNNE